MHDLSRAWRYREGEGSPWTGHPVLSLLRMAQKISPDRENEMKEADKIRKTGSGFHDLKPTIWVGKQGITDTIIDEIRAQIKVRRVIKLKWLASTEVDPDGVASASRTILLQVRGRTMVLGDPKMYPSPGSRNV